ncbi:hypothetical protein JYT74_02370 [Crocinitomix catalasitica]|nr:hypothetical protein [Crocinitomix catalasitica]
MKTVIGVICMTCSLNANAQMNGATINYDEVISSLPQAKEIEARLINHMKELEKKLKEFCESPSYPDQGNLSNKEYRELIMKLTEEQERQIKEFQMQAQQEMEQYRLESERTIRKFIKSKMEEFSVQKQLDFISADQETFICPACADYTQEFIAFVEEN